MVEIDVPAYLNPITSIQECLEYFIDNQKEKVDTISWEIEDLKYEINSLWFNDNEFEAENLEEELTVLKYNLEEEENVLSNYEQIKDEMLSSPNTITEFTKEVSGNDSHGLHEINLFDEEVTVIYMKHISIDTSKPIPSAIIKQIEEILQKKGENS